MFRKTVEPRLFPIINRLLKKSESLTVAIDGSSSSGKTTLAYYLKKEYECNIFHMDNFFLRPEQKTKSRLTEVGGNIDYERFKSEVLDKLNSSSTFEYQIYDCTIKKLTNYIKVIPNRFNIIEGVYSMHPTLTSYYDLKIFLQTNEITQKQRIIKRNGEFMLQRFLDEWIPKENEYFTQMDIPSKCDLIIHT